MAISEKLLQHSFIYSLSQLILAPGAQYILHRKINRILENLPKAKTVVDIGCGPESWLWKSGHDPIGIDISHTYSKTFITKGSLAVTGSAVSLPFKTSSVDAAWCIGVLHHLDDNQVRQFIDESTRIVKENGNIVILDAVLPQKPFIRPIASAIRKNDRGKFMRTESELKSLLSQSRGWKTERYSYSLTGLEMLEMVSK